MPPRLDLGDDQDRLLAALSAGPGRPGRPRRGGSEPPKGLLYWLPVVVALGLFAQVSLLGLKSALTESGRLLRAEKELCDRVLAEQERARRLGRVLRAQSDPIYLERERRLLQDPEGGLRDR